MHNKAKAEVAPDVVDFGGRDKATTNFVRDTNDRVTVRGNLQSRRSQLNREIHREMRLRAGAENLMRATTNKYIRDTAHLELSFVNSHLELLRDQLSELNGQLEIYQHGMDTLVPMITLGLKETKEIDVRESFRDFIMEHYSEDPAPHEAAILQFMELRQAMRRPSRDSKGVQLLLKYLTVLYFVERRFFPADRNIGVHFLWFDSLTGIPSTQRTVAFEKASVLFNLAALYSQIGSRQDRRQSDSADEAVDNFLRAAGTLRYIGDHFTHPPSFDLGPQTLEGLVGIFIAQSRECLFEKQIQIDLVDTLSMVDGDGVGPEVQGKLLELAQEAKLLADEYTRVSDLLHGSQSDLFWPPAWTSLVQVKQHLYSGTANQYLALLLLNPSPLTPETLEAFNFLYTQDPGDHVVTDIRTPSTPEERRVLGLCHLRQAFMNLEDAQRSMRLNKELRGKVGLQTVLGSMKDRLLVLCEAVQVGGTEELDGYLDPPLLVASTKFQLSLSPPDLSTNVADPFHALGPLALFSAKRHWSAPRHVTLRRRGGFGLSVKGSAPVAIAGVDDGSSAEAAGVRPGDIIVGINERDAKFMTHEEIVSTVRNAGDILSLRLVTPVEETKGRLSPHSTASSSGSSLYGTTYPRSASSASSGGSLGQSTDTMRKISSLFRSKKTESPSAVR